MPRVIAPAPPRYHVTRRNWKFPFGRAKGRKFDEVFEMSKAYIDALIERRFITVNQKLYARLENEYYDQIDEWDGLEWWDFMN